MARVMECSRRFYKWVRHALGKLNCSRVWSSLVSPFDCLTLGDHIPSAVYSTDIRIMLVLTAIYPSLLTQIAQNAYQETTGDVNGGMNFKVNSEFINNSISGGVSDRIFWNCREDSRTNFYYKTLYLGLILSYLVAVVIYFIARLFVTGFIANAAWTLTYQNKQGKVHHLELMANGRKMINQLGKNLQQKTNRAIKRNQSFDEFKAEIERLATEWNVKWKNLVGDQYKSKKFLYNWLTILYIIPRCETLIMLIIITFALTSYDIHPLGCLFEIDVDYNKMDKSVILQVSHSVILYREASVIVIFLLVLLWGMVKIVQHLLIPRRWGLVITNKCSCSSKETKCCSANCIFPWGENDLYDDDDNNEASDNTSA